MGLFENEKFEEFLKQKAIEDEQAKIEHNSVDHETIIKELILPEEAKTDQEQDKS